MAAEKPSFSRIKNFLDYNGFRFYKSDDYDGKKESLGITDDGCCKVHFAVQDDQKNLDLAAELFIEVADRDEFKDLPLFFKITEAPKTDQPALREGVELTIYIPGIFEYFEKPLEIANKWLDFFEAVESEFTAKNVVPETITETDRAIGRFSSYRLGPNFAVAPKHDDEEVMSFDINGSMVLNVGGNMLEVSNKQTREAMEENPGDYNPFGFPDQFGIAIAQRKNKAPATKVDTSVSEAKEEKHPSKGKAT